MEEENQVRVGLHHPYGSQPLSLVELGKKILQLATNVVDKVIESISSTGQNIHPFPPDLLEQVRSLCSRIPSGHSLWRTTILLGPPSGNGRDGRWSRLPILWDPEDRSATGSEPPLKESRHLAYQRRTKRGESPSPGGPPRTGELCFSRDPFGRYPERPFGIWIWSLAPLLLRRRHPSVDVTYQITMPRSYGRYRWRRQDPHHLRWLLGRCQCTHSGQYRRTHHSPYSHGLPPRHSLVAGVTKKNRDNKSSPM